VSAAAVEGAGATLAELDFKRPRALPKERGALMENPSSISHEIGSRRRSYFNHFEQLVVKPPSHSNQAFYVRRGGPPAVGISSIHTRIVQPVRNASPDFAARPPSSVVLECPLD